MSTLNQYVLPMTASRPISTTYQVLKDHAGKNRVIIDTSATPWNNYFDSGAANIFTFISMFTYDYVVYAGSLFFRISRDEVSKRPDLLFAAFEMQFCSRYDEMFSALEDIDDDDDVSVLWKKVVKVEKLVYEFLRLAHFLRTISHLPGAEMVGVGKYTQLLDFVRLHTNGHVHVYAKNMLSDYSAEPVEITYATRDWKCPVCCERGRNSHMCITKRCGHVFHYACLTKTEFPDCPCCRVLDD